MTLQGEPGLIAIRLNDDDELAEVVPTNGLDKILLSSRLGQTICFEESNVRATGRPAAGVLGIRFKKPGDEVVACNIAGGGASLLHLTANGFGKRTPVEEYRTQYRGGKGVIGIKLTADKGPVVGALVVEDHDEILAVTVNGVVIRTPAEAISAQSRNASGVKVMNPDEGDVVASVVLVTPDDDGLDDDGLDDDGLDDDGLDDDGLDDDGLDDDGLDDGRDSVDESGSVNE